MHSVNRFQRGQIATGLAPAAEDTQGGGVITVHIFFADQELRTFREINAVVHKACEYVSMHVAKFYG